MESLDSTGVLDPFKQRRCDLLAFVGGMNVHHIQMSVSLEVCKAGKRLPDHRNPRQPVQVSGFPSGPIGLRPGIYLRLSIIP